MQTVQRHFGKARTADQSQVAVLLKDFEDADKMLARVSPPSQASADPPIDQCLDHRGFQGMARCLDRYLDCSATALLRLPGHVFTHCRVQ